MAEILYRFLSCDHALNVMKDRQLKVSLIRELNDVYDCEPILLSNSGSDLPPNLVDWESEPTLRVAQKRLGLLCFSKTYKSPLLWGHYADHAKGIALGFDPDHFSLKDPITVSYKGKRPTFRIPPPWSTLEVAASQIRDHHSREERRTPRIPPRVLDDAQIAWQIRDCFSKKAKDWSYEEEVRYLVCLDDCVPREVNRKDMYFFKFDDRALCEVVIGPRCPRNPETVEKVVTTHYPGMAVKILTAKMHRDKYKIEGAEVLPTHKR
jgi:hypothetical protein